MSSFTGSGGRGDDVVRRPMILINLGIPAFPAKGGASGHFAHISPVRAADVRRNAGNRGLG
jgi:hypothetical protein